MRALFLISDTSWSSSARVFMLAARGLSARGHDVLFACESECPVQVRAAESEINIITLPPGASTAGDAWQLRRTFEERVDAVFVHSESELLVATSALRLGRGAGAVIRRIPPFSIASLGRGARFATRIAPTGLLFSTEADREAADVRRSRVASAVAPLGVDVDAHARVPEVAKASFGAPPVSQVIVCVHDDASSHRALMALRTLALLAPRHPDLHVAFVGGGAQEELRMHGAALGVSAMVSFLGARDDELSIIRAANIGWIAAEGDAAALAALDFMSFKTPVLAERTMLTEHYVADGIAGVLLAPADPTTTAAAVAAFLAKDDLRVAMGTAGFARLQREFSYGAMVEGFEKAMAGAAERSAQPVR
jgi:glycosyltransferase involved in cell wall biosynthesis